MLNLFLRHDTSYVSPASACFEPSRLDESDSKPFRMSDPRDHSDHFGPAGLSFLVFLVFPLVRPLARQTRPLAHRLTGPPDAAPTPVPGGGQFRG